MGATLGLAAIGAAATVDRVLRTDSGRLPALNLATHESLGLQALEVDVRDHLTEVSPGLWRTTKLDASPFTMIGFVWPASATGAAPAVTARVARRGAWEPWQAVPLLHDLPDAGTPEAGGHIGTQVVWKGRSTGVQYQVRGALPVGMKVVLLHPRPQQEDSARSTDLGLASFSPGLLRPSILTRSQWGADESWRKGAVSYCAQVRQVHVHHTASVNAYGAEDVPAMIRGMYRFHTHNLGWNDIAYNFLVDRYGRVWEGRAGGTDRFVQGAHTLGFNSTSVGVSVIGNFDQGSPTAQIVESVAAVAAWKVAIFGGKPTASTTVTSTGSDRFRSGQTVTLPVIDGHRDTNETACPGGALYSALPRIRQRARQLIAESWAAQNPVGVATEPSLSGRAIAGETLAVVPGAFDPASAAVSYAWLRNGVAIAGATARSYNCTLADLGAVIAARVTASAPRRASAVRDLAAGRVRALPALRVRTRVRRGVVVVGVRAAPPAGIASVPSGTVRVRVRRRVQDAALVDGLARVRFDDLAAGRARVWARYLGSDSFTPVSLDAPLELTVP